MKKGKNNENNIKRCNIVQHIASKGENGNSGYPNSNIGAYHQYGRRMGWNFHP